MKKINLLIILMLFSCAHEQTVQDDSKRLLSEEATLFNSSKQSTNQLSELDYQLVESNDSALPELPAQVTQPEIPKPTEPNIQSPIVLNQDPSLFTIPEPKTPLTSPVLTIKDEPQKTTVNTSSDLVMYTPLWVYIPAPACAELIPSNRYPNGACIRRH